MMFVELCNSVELQYLYFTKHINFILCMWAARRVHWDTIADFQLSAVCLQATGMGGTEWAQLIPWAWLTLPGLPRMAQSVVGISVTRTQKTLGEWHSWVLFQTLVSKLPLWMSFTRLPVPVSVLLFQHHSANMNWMLIYSVSPRSCTIRSIKNGNRKENNFENNKESLKVRGTRSKHSSR